MSEKPETAAKKIEKAIEAILINEKEVLDELMAIVKSQGPSNVEAARAMLDHYSRSKTELIKLLMKLPPENSE